MISVRNLFRKRLRSARAARDLTQFQLGDAMDVDQATVQRWEAGKTWPDPEDIAKLSEILYVSPSFFFSDESLPIPEPTPYQALEILKKVVDDRYGRTMDSK